MPRAGARAVPRAGAPGRTWLWPALDTAFAAFSLWLAGGRQMQFMAATFDDALFARLANSLRDGAWLGAYDKLTLAKGPGYPAFLALTSATGIPLRLAEQAVFLLGCWLLAGVAGRLSGRRWLATAMFAAGSLNPVAWGVSLDRIARENLYLGLTVVVLGLAARLLLVPPPAPRAGGDGSVGRSADRPAAWGVALGLALAAFWLTREEGAWLAPPLGLLVLDWLCRRWAARPRGAGRARFWAASALALLMPCLAFAAADLAVAAANRRAYGVFETNDFRSREFKAAYGALSRIEHEQWRRLVPVPRDARRAAYAASPAAAELAAGLEGRNGQAWQEVGCSWIPMSPCDDIQSAWFLWALRDAAEGAGHHRDAKNAARFYARVAREVNEACDAGTLRCLPPRTGFLPPLRREHLPIMAGDAGQLLLMLARLGGEPPADACSDDDPATIAAFRRVALGPWTPGGGACHPALHGDIRVLGWVFAPSGPVDVRAVAAGGNTVSVTPAPDVSQALQMPTGVAARFGGIIGCGDGPCRVVAQGGGTTAEKDVGSLSNGYAVNTPSLRLWIDEVGAGPQDARNGPDWSRPRRAVAAAVSAVLRAAFVPLLPLAVLLALGFTVLDLVRARRERFRLRPWVCPLSTLWLVLLAAMGARVGLLAVLDATSFPAIATLYLSPATGPALLLVAGTLGDCAIRLRGRRN